MQDSVLNEALKRLAAEASIRFTSLVATGEGIPFDVAENNGDSSHFYRYVPLTSNFFDSHAGELKSLPGYGPARGVVVASGVASPYLEARGLAVASDPEVRAEAMIEIFIRELWEGAAEFSLDLSCVEAALDRLEVAARDIREAKVLIAPLSGFEMTPTEIELAGGIRIVQSDAVEAPVEATSSEGSERSAWQPAYLAMVPLSESPDGPRSALAAMTDLVRALRIFKEGSVGLGPYAFAPVGEDAWRRIETGATPSRPGSYFLIESEVPRLEEFMRRFADDTPELERLGFATERFQLGCERPRPLDALSDHLLAIRSALGGQGMIDAPFSARAAALITGRADDSRARGRIDAAMDLELSLINGEDAMTAGNESAAYLAAWVEDSARHILCEAVLGNFGANPNVAAEETLITGGLLAGEISSTQAGSTAEWDIVYADEGDQPEEEPFREAEIHVLRPNPSGETDSSPAEGVDRLFGSVPEFESEPTEPTGLQPMPEIEEALGITPGSTRLLEPVPDPGEITVSATREIGASLREDWLGETRHGSTLEWPAVRSADSGSSREGGHAPRDKGLFPSPDTTEWTVSELKYRRHRSS